jgi:hypothetical protein
MVEVLVVLLPLVLIDKAQWTQRISWFLAFPSIPSQDVVMLTLNIHSYYAKHFLIG